MQLPQSLLILGQSVFLKKVNVYRKDYIYTVLYSTEKVIFTHIAVRLIQNDIPDVLPFHVYSAVFSIIIVTKGSESPAVLCKDTLCWSQSSGCIEIA